LAGGQKRIKEVSADRGESKREEVWLTPEVFGKLLVHVKKERLSQEGEKGGRGRECGVRKTVLRETTKAR